MAYGRDGKAAKKYDDLDVPKDHKVTLCDSCGCTVIVKPKANIPDDCPACRHAKQQSNQTKRRIRRS